jgi:serine/threonine-protein kinase
MSASNKPPRKASSRPPPKKEPLLGTTLGGRYKLERVLGRGGMGAVYQAVNHLGKRFAVKVILTEAANASLDATKRFVREAKAASVIESEHVVGVADADTDAATGVPFIVMDLLSGTDLSGLMERVGAVEPVAAVRIALHACRGLRAAHARSVVHRDIKPANIFLDTRDNGQVIAKICDFGIAKTVATDTMDQTSATLTRTGGMLGSPLYMSPQQARNAKHVDASTDIWSLCLSLYEVLSGTRPWAHCTTLGELILAICTEDLRPLRSVAPWIDPGLAAVVHRGLQRDPSVRWRRMDELAEALRPFSGGTEQITVPDLVGVPHEVRAAAAAVAPTAHSVAPPQGTGSQPSITGPTNPQPSSAHAIGLESTLGANASALSTAGRERPRGGTRVALAAAAGVVILVGIGTATLVRLKTRARAARQTPVAVLPGPSIIPAAPATSSEVLPPASAPVAATRLASLIVLPPTAKVTVNGASRDLVDGTLRLEGDPGDRVNVAATAGSARVERMVTILKGGQTDPDRIDVVAAVSAASPQPSAPVPVAKKRAPSPAPAPPAAASAAAPTGPTLKSTWP